MAGARSQIAVVGGSARRDRDGRRQRQSAIEIVFVERARADSPVTEGVDFHPSIRDATLHTMMRPSLGVDSPDLIDFTGVSSAGRHVDRTGDRRVPDEMAREA
jgi:hypothetical protein